MKNASVDVDLQSAHSETTGTKIPALADASQLNAKRTHSGTMSFASACAKSQQELRRALMTNTGIMNVANVFASHLRMEFVISKNSQAIGILELASASALNSIARLVSTLTTRRANANACHRTVLSAITGTRRPAAANVFRKDAQKDTSGTHLLANANAYTMKLYAQLKNTLTLKLALACVSQTAPANPTQIRTIHNIGTLIYALVCALTRLHQTQINSSSTSNYAMKLESQFTALPENSSIQRPGSATSLPKTAQALTCGTHLQVSATALSSLTTAPTLMKSSMKKDVSARSAKSNHALTKTV